MNTEITTAKKWKELGQSGGSVPAVWVGCLGCYNSGLLNGSWVDAINAGDINNSVEVETGNPIIYGDACQVCVRCGSDEFWVFDTDNMPEAKEMSPYEAQRIAETLELLENGSIEKEAYEAYAYLNSLDIVDFEEWKSDAEDNYSGQYDSDEEFAEGLVESIGEIDTNHYLYQYLDWAKFARDLMFDYSEHNGYYFNN